MWFFIAGFPTSFVLKNKKLISCISSGVYDSKTNTIYSVTRGGEVTINIDSGEIKNKQCENANKFYSGLLTMQKECKHSLEYKDGRGISFEYEDEGPMFDSFTDEDENEVWDNVFPNFNELTQVIILNDGSKYSLEKNERITMKYEENNKKYLSGFSYEFFEGTTKIINLISIEVNENVTAVLRKTKIDAPDVLKKKAFSL